MAFDWDSATVKVTVPVHHTATVEKQEVEMPLRTFGALLLTNLPAEWFAEPPVSADLPLYINKPV
jgi:hypothetical protein